MSQKIIHGFTQFEIEALRIPLSARNECLKYLIPYKRCFLNSSFISTLAGAGSCQDLKREYVLCQQPYTLRKTGQGAIFLKHNDQCKFSQQNISASLDKNYRPTFMNAKLGH